MLLRRSELAYVRSTRPCRPFVGVARAARSRTFPTRGGDGARRPALRGKLDPSAWRSAPALEPSEGEQDDRYDERTDRVLGGDVSGARPEPREKRGKATCRNEPVHGGDGQEQEAKKSGDQRQGSVHRADVREDRKFSVTAPSVRYTPGGPPDTAYCAVELIWRVLPASRPSEGRMDPHRRLADARSRETAPEA